MFHNKGGTLIVSCSNDKTIRVWDVYKAQLIYTLRRHTEEVTSVCFNKRDPTQSVGGNAERSRGTLIVSGSYDNTVRVWKLGL